MRYNLKNNQVLLPYQVVFLRDFFASPLTEQFFLTGGTALSAFYLAHRESKDLDLFCMRDFEMRQIETLISDIAKKMKCEVSAKVSTSSYSEIYLHNKWENWTQRIDVVKEQPKHFGEIEQIGGVRIDSLENIGSNKICAILGRIEIKDYIDLYEIIRQSKWTFSELWELAKQKDLGLNEFTLANSIVDIEQIGLWPKMLIEIDREEMTKYYKDLVSKLLMLAKPE